MHPELTSFVAEMPTNDEKAMDAFQEMINKVAEETNKYAENLAKELGVSDWCAMDITYLRGWPHWTQELENRLIAADKAGKPCPKVLSGEESEWLDENGF